MKSSVKCVRVTVLLSTLALLYGCAAATVIRKQPDFDEENKRLLQQTFQGEKVTVATFEEAAR